MGRAFLIMDIDQKISQEIVVLEELVAQCDEAIEAWNDHCKSCGFGPGIVRSLAVERIALLKFIST